MSIHGRLRCATPGLAPACSTYDGDSRCITGWAMKQACLYWGYILVGGSLHLLWVLLHLEHR